MQIRKRHRIQFPVIEADHLSQDETYFHLIRPDGGLQTIRFHDYDEIYRHPGLYEQIFYDRLRCQSPAKVASVLKSSVEQSEGRINELRVLDFGAGNGMMAQELQRYGVARLVGVDILPEARDAALRDRPEVYDAYYVADFTQLDDKTRAKIKEWSVDCLVTVAALGFGDIPPVAFLEAINLIKPQGWIAFNIKETFFDHDDTSRFSVLIRELILSKHLDLYHLERYRHRDSIEGKPLYYLAVTARKRNDLSLDLIDRFAEAH